MGEIIEAILEVVFRALFEAISYWCNCLFIRERAEVRGSKKILSYSANLRWTGALFLLIVVALTAVAIAGGWWNQTVYLVLFGTGLGLGILMVADFFTTQVVFDDHGFMVRSWRKRTALIPWTSVSSWEPDSWLGYHVARTNRGAVRISNLLSGVPDFSVFVHDVHRPRATRSRKRQR